ncbi:hypothetical protein TEA_021432 [Camellia sinensis var. sinensis]|uniref:DNA/RNA-binding protein Alba-like domain-containing protein n=1 Tax=Camellia sinensis var. sinensis TaxID=542762 RepID=A0A4V3WQQ8_CAMSN|nr:hypothetical protein TEA_021432 [Camellia sinensis var. sinensis]
MDRYQRIEKPRPETPINENEIRITTQGRMRNYITYATTLLQEKGSNEIVLKAMGRAINKTVMIAELIKRRIAGIHENTSIGSMDITDMWEPLEEGLLLLETTHHVSVITITLSKEELVTSSAGYQPPIPVDQVKPWNEYDYEGEGSPNMRGRGRGSQGRSRGRGRDPSMKWGIHALEDFLVSKSNSNATLYFSLSKTTMEMVAGMVDVGMEQEVGVGEEDVVFMDAEEDMVVEICNKSWVVTMAMVAQGHHLLKAVVSTLITKCLIRVVEYNGDGGWDGGRGYGARGWGWGRGRGFHGRGRGYGGGDMQQELGGYNGYGGSGPPLAQGCEVPKSTIHRVGYCKIFLDSSGFTKLSKFIQILFIVPSIVFSISVFEQKAIWIVAGCGRGRGRSRGRGRGWDFRSDGPIQAAA